MKRSFAILFVLIFMLTMVACSAPRRFDAAHQIVSVAAFDQDANESNSVNQTFCVGGAAILSPRHILLSVHQFESGPQRCYVQGLGEVIAMPGPRHRDPINPKCGWEIRELEAPLVDVRPIRFARDPHEYDNQRCYLFRRSDIEKLSGGSIQDFFASFERIALKTYRGVLIPDELSRSEPGNMDLDDKLLIRLDPNQGVGSVNDFEGASGYPVVVYDRFLSEWIAIGIVDSIEFNVEHSCFVVVATVPSSEIIERFRLPAIPDVP